MESCENDTITVDDDLSINQSDQREIQQYTEIIPEKKKRGRKPKNLLLQNASLEQVQSQVDNETVPEPQMINGSVVLNAPKKRGRKSDKLISIIDETPKVQTLICHLPLNQSDIKKITSQMESLNIDILEPIQTETQAIKTYNAPKLVDLNDDHKCYKHKTKTFDDECVNCLLHMAEINKLHEEIDKLKNGIIECSTSFNKKIYEGQ